MPLFSKTHRGFTGDVTYTFGDSETIEKMEDWFEYVVYKCPRREILMNSEKFATVVHQVYSAGGLEGV